MYPWYLYMAQMVKTWLSIQWCHNERDGVSNHQPHDYLLNRLFKAKIKETSKLRVSGLYVGEFTGDRWIPRTKAH